MNLSRPVLPALLFAVACSSPTESPPISFAAPPDLGDGLGGAAAVERGIDPAALVALLEEVDAGGVGEIHSVLVWKGGDLIMEEYRPGTMIWDATFRDFDRTMRQSIYSVSKSFTSTAIGLALDEGLIPSLDTPALDLVPEYATAADPSLRDISLRNLLTMSAGLDWDELSTPYGSETNSHTQMNRADNELEYVLSLPLAHTPGTRFEYNSGLTHLMGEIVKVAVGEPMDSWLEERLFRPLGFENTWWYTYPSGVTHAGGGLHLRSRDMMKFGVLFLQDGVWQGERLLPDGWVAQATGPRAPGGFYGFQWWRDVWQSEGATITSYSAQGFGGQFIIVFPTLDMVVVFTGANRGEAMFNAFGLVRRHLLPALR